MNSKKLKMGLWLVLIVLCIPMISFGQSVQCTRQLNQARVLYDQGRLDEVIAELNRNKCLRTGFSKEQQATAYRLMALVYLYKDDQPNAEEAIISLLTVDPERPIDEINDPAEFVSLYRQFRTKPIFRVGFILGLNQSNAISSNSYGTFSFTDSIGIKKTFSSGLGFQGGATIEYSPVPILEIVLRTIYMQQNYSVSNNIIDVDEELDASVFRISNLQETMSWLRVPLALRVYIPIPKFKPYAFAGVSLDYLLGSTMTGSREGTTTLSVSGLDLMDLDMRERINWKYFGGVGAKFDIKRTQSLFAEISYSVGGQNIVKSQNRFASQDLLSNIAHVDDDKSINGVSLSVGWVTSIYKPIKYKETKLRRDAAKLLKRRTKQREK
ncbi:MAG: outer membrane beta-barrel protein [Bacteroidota bacterium]